MEKEKRENVRIIEKSSLDVQSKQDLFLVYVNAKPAMRYPSYSKYYRIESEVKKRENLQKIESGKKEIEEILKIIKLFYLFEEFLLDDNGLKGYRFLIGKNEKNVIELRDALKSESAEEIGLALGYPKTAVRAFAEGEILDKYDYLRFLPQKEKEKLEKEKIFKFVNFGLSKENWKEELNIIRNYQILIKQNAPSLYNEIIKKRKGLL